MLSELVDLLPEQRPSPLPIEERALWSAVIHQAIDDMKGVSDSNNSWPKKRLLRMEQAKAWFRSDMEHPGSFVWICETLRLDPDRIRLGLFGE